MEKVAASKLRENLKIFLKKVEIGESITITSRGRQVAKLVPVENKREVSKKSLKQLRKNAVIGDILSPTGEKWEAME